jgi:hypothetical protein
MSTSSTRREFLSTAAVAAMAAGAAGAVGVEAKVEADPVEEHQVEAQRPEPRRRRKGRGELRNSYFYAQAQLIVCARSLQLAVDAMNALPADCYRTGRTYDSDDSVDDDEHTWNVMCRAGDAADFVMDALIGEVLAYAPGDVLRHVEAQLGPEWERER